MSEEYLVAEAPLNQLSFVVPVRRKLNELEMQSIESAFNVLFNVTYLVRAAMRLESRANLRDVTDANPNPNYVTIAVCNGVRRDDVPYEHSWNADGTPVLCVIDSAIEVLPLPETAWHPEGS